MYFNADGDDMINWDRLNKSLISVDANRQCLLDKFDCFARQAYEKINSSNFHIKGIEIEPLGDENYFLTKFAGRTVRFQFDAAFVEGGLLSGFVNCFLVEGFPDLGCRKLGSFKFSASGKTDFINDGDGDGDALLIDTDIGALYIVLNYIHKSLEQFPK